jgi:hypothetical protein
MLQIIHNMQKNNHDCFVTSRVIFNFFNFLDSKIYFTIILRSNFTSFAKTEMKLLKEKKLAFCWRKKLVDYFMTALYTAIHCYAASQVVAGKFLPLFYAPLYWDYDTYFYSSPNWKKVLFQPVKNHCFSESTFFQNFYLTYSGNNHIIFVWIWSSNFPNVFWMKFWLIYFQIEH